MIFLDVDIMTKEALLEDILAKKHSNMWLHLLNALGFELVGHWKPEHSLVFGSLSHFSNRLSKGNGTLPDLFLYAGIQPDYLLDFDDGLHVDATLSPEVRSVMKLNPYLTYKVDEMPLIQRNPSTLHLGAEPAGTIVYPDMHLLHLLNYAGRMSRNVYAIAGNIDDDYAAGALSDALIAKIMSAYALFAIGKEYNTFYDSSLVSSSQFLSGVCDIAMFSALANYDDDFKDEREKFVARLLGEAIGLSYIISSGVRVNNKGEQFLGKDEEYAGGKPACISGKEDFDFGDIELGKDLRKVRLGSSFLNNVSLDAGNYFLPFNLGDKAKEHAQKVASSIVSNAGALLHQPLFFDRLRRNATRNIGVVKVLQLLGDGVDLRKMILDPFHYFENLKDYSARMKDDYTDLMLNIKSLHIGADLPNPSFSRESLQKEHRFEYSIIVNSSFRDRHVLTFDSKLSKSSTFLQRSRKFKTQIAYFSLYKFLKNLDGPYVSLFLEKQHEMLNNYLGGMRVGID